MTITTAHVYTYTDFRTEGLNLLYLHIIIIIIEKNIELLKLNIHLI